MTQLSAGDWLTLTEAAALIGFTPGRLSQVVKASGIPHTPIGRQIMIRKQDALTFKKNRKPAGRPKKKK